MGKRTVKPADRKYSTYVYRVLKQVHSDTGISAKAMAIMDSFIKDLMDRVIKEAVELCDMGATARMTLSSREVQTAVRLVLPGEVAKHAVSEGTKAVTKCMAGGKGAPTSKKAGLQFPVARVKAAMKAKTNKRIGAGAPVYLTSVLEYLCAEVLELAGNCARDNKKTRIIPRHLLLAIENDEELHKLLQHCIIPDAGVLPNIHAMLIPAKSMGTLHNAQEY
eukprot:TRINITY_DN1634_c0_g2_i2.p1 TRINITY_DN1634_c0_g2~~TRINITY_DN1634_c0_g2_i2.p1  ORF type:complete len:235 (-),score=28.76 TRINITY_DN1634_c0_g2_i2:89-751(-)